MATLRSLFELRLDSAEGIRGATNWQSFERDVEDYGLGSDMLRKTISAARSRAAVAGRPVQYLDLTTAAALFSPDQETEQVIQDLRQDGAALTRFVDYVVSRYSKRDAPERRQMNAGKHAQPPANDHAHAR
jgi:hypothetical protein